MSERDRIDPVDRAVMAVDAQLLSAVNNALDLDAGLAAIKAAAEAYDVDEGVMAVDAQLLSAVNNALDLDAGLAAIKAAARKNAPARDKGKTSRLLFVRPTGATAASNEGADDGAPPDPFAGDPSDPAANLEDLDDDAPAGGQPLTPAEREDVLADLEDLEIFRALLSPRGVRGIVVECEDCGQSHYFGWELMRSNLRHLLEAGRTRVHEPAYEPDPTRYVSWEYARGFADGAFAAAEED